MRRHYLSSALALGVALQGVCSASAAPRQQDPQVVLDEVRRLQEPLETVALRLRVLVENAGAGGGEPPGPVTVKVEGLDDRLAALQAAAESLVEVAKELRPRRPRAAARIRSKINDAADALEDIKRDVGEIKNRVGPSGSNRRPDLLRGICTSIDALVEELRAQRRRESFEDLARRIADELKRVLASIGRSPAPSVDLSTIEKLLGDIRGDIARLQDGRHPEQPHFERVVDLLEAAVDAMVKIEMRLALIPGRGVEPPEPERLRPVVESAVEQLRAELVAVRNSIGEVGNEVTELGKHEWLERLLGRLESMRARLDEQIVANTAELQGLRTDLAREGQALRDPAWLRPLFEWVIEELRGQHTAVAAALARIDTRIAELPRAAREVFGAAVAEIRAELVAGNAKADDVRRILGRIEAAVAGTPAAMRPQLDSALKDVRTDLAAITAAVGRVDARIEAMPAAARPLFAWAVRELRTELAAGAARVDAVAEAVRRVEGRLAAVPEVVKPLLEWAVEELRVDLAAGTAALGRIEGKVAAMPTAVKPLFEQAVTRLATELAAGTAKADDILRSLRRIEAAIAGMSAGEKPPFEHALRDVRADLAAIAAALGKLDTRVGAMPAAARPLFVWAVRQLRSQLVAGNAKTDEVLRSLTRIESAIAGMPAAVKPQLELALKGVRTDISTATAAIGRIDARIEAMPGAAKPLFQWIVTELRAALAAGDAKVDAVAAAVAGVDRRVAALPEAMQPLFARAVQDLRADLAAGTAALGRIEARVVAMPDAVKPLFLRAVTDLRAVLAVGGAKVDAVAAAVARVEQRVAALPEDVKPQFEQAVLALRAELAAGWTRIDDVAKAVRAFDSRLAALPGVIEPIHGVTAEVRALRADLAAQEGRGGKPNWIDPLVAGAVAELRTELAAGRLATKVDAVSAALGAITHEVEELRKGEWLQPMLAAAAERVRAELAGGQLPMKVDAVSRAVGRIDGRLAGLPDVVTPLDAVATELRGLREDVGREFEDVREPSWIAPLFERAVADLRTEIGAGRLTTKVENVTTELVRLRADLALGLEMVRRGGNGESSLGIGTSIDNLSAAVERLQTGLGAISAIEQDLERLTAEVAGQRAVSEQLAASLAGLGEAIDGVAGLGPSLEGVAALKEPLQQIPGSQIWLIVLAILTNLSVIALLVGSFRIRRSLQQELTASGAFEGQVSKQE